MSNVDEFIEGRKEILRAELVGRIMAHAEDYWQKPIKVKRFSNSMKTSEYHAVLGLFGLLEHFYYSVEEMQNYLKVKDRNIIIFWKAELIFHASRSEVFCERLSHCINKFENI
jgi:hypothetical protein